MVNLFNIVAHSDKNEHFLAVPPLSFCISPYYFDIWFALCCVFEQLMSITSFFFPCIASVLLHQDECCVQTLTLADCHIGDSELKVLLGATRVTYGLHTLDLSCNDIGERSVPSLIQ